MYNKEIMFLNDYKEMLYVIVQNRVKLDSFIFKISVIFVVKENDVIGLFEFMVFLSKNC